MYNIVSDSSLDEEYYLKENIRIVPFKIDLDETTYIDNYELDNDFFVEKMKESKMFKTSCPSPNDYYNMFKEKGNVFCITISSKLSGSYNSAILAKKMIEEEFNKKIQVIDSMGASTTLVLVYKRLKEYIEKGYTFDEISNNILEYVKNIDTFFILESLDNLKKAGRISSVKFLVAKSLNIVPIMAAKDGVIEKLTQVRGKNKAFDKLVDLIVKKASKKIDVNLVISHVNDYSRANELKQNILKKINIKNIEIIGMSALNSLYAGGKGGIIVSF